MMPYTFEEARQAYKVDKLQELAQDFDGIRFLKLRSLSRKAYLKRLYERAGAEAESNLKKDIFEALYKANISAELIHEVIHEIYEEKRAERREEEDELVNQLYRVRSFGWGGIYQNSLERHIVNNYVKKIKSYEVLNAKIEDELHQSMREYTVASWYNHWTSIIIEDIFKDHDRVLPAVGRIKKIDFFLDDVPFDLKVTYLPEGYIKDRRHNYEMRSELTLLKKAARSLEGVKYDENLSRSVLKEDLWQKLEVHPSDEATELIADLRSFRLEKLESIKDNPVNLITWLYENQGIRRFDASNRLFLILVDEDNFFESWKLKRAKPLLDATIHDHIDQIADNPGRDIHFDWNGVQYTCKSDVILVTKSHPVID
jgi:hypothetical protein